MQIISDFHDYYDIGMQNGIDPQLPYRRFRREEPVKFPRSDDWRSFGHRAACFDFSDMGYCILYFGFAGKIYPSIDVVLNMTDVAKPSFCFDLTLIEDAFFIDFAKNKPWHWGRPPEKTKDIKYVAERTKKQIHECFEFKHTPELLNLFEQFKTAIFVYQLGNKTIVINERLNLYHFQKVLPPMVAFQELAMYVGAKLTKPVIEEPPISDKIKAEIHGFDKHSFRKAKTTK